MGSNITFDAIESTIKEREKKTSNVKTTSFNEKNYLNIRLGKGETKKELKIRLLPIDKDSQTPFKIIKMHTLKVPTEVSKSGWKSYVCLSETEDIDHDVFGNKCPFCELRDEAWRRSKETNNEVEKKKWISIAKENYSKEVCILRCIERGHEEDGPKFLKFNIHKNGDDLYHSIINLVRTRRQENIDDGISQEEAGNILDLYKGKDLKLTITADNSEQSNKTGISVVDYGREKPLSDNQEEMERWINDDKKWGDVFVTKPYDYLSIILDGKVPFFDKNLRTWVCKSDDEEDSKYSSDVETNNVTIEDNYDVDNTDELPF